MAEVSGVSSGSSTNTVSRDQVGIAGLTADDFMKMLITQLQNQDPTEPVTNEDLLNQISTMRNLQSDVELSDTLKSLTLNQQLSTTANFIGKLVTARDAGNDPVTGIVDRVFIQDGKAFVGIGDDEFSVDQISDIRLPSDATPTETESAASVASAPAETVTAETTASETSSPLATVLEPFFGPLQSFELPAPKQFLLSQQT